MPQGAGSTSPLIHPAPTTANRRISPRLVCTLARPGHHRGVPTATPTNPDLAGRTVAVTGHRPQALTDEQADFARAELDRVIDKLAPTIGISGMALGADTWWADLCLDRGVPLYAFVPFPGQPDRWPATDQRHYRTILERADRVLLCADSYHRGVFHVRNQAMIDAAELVVAVWNGSTTGGTAHAVSIARPHLPIVRINPVSRTTSLLLPPPPAQP